MAVLKDSGERRQYETGAVRDILCLHQERMMTVQEDNDSLIKIISQAGNRYGEKLLDFLERYHLPGLMFATTEQLQEYIAVEGLTERKVQNGKTISKRRRIC